MDQLGEDLLADPDLWIRGGADLATLTVLAVNSWSHDLASKSHGESENRKFTRQFQ